MSRRKVFHSFSYIQAHIHQQVMANVLQICMQNERLTQNHLRQNVHYYYNYYGISYSYVCIYNIHISIYTYVCTSYVWQKSKRERSECSVLQYNCYFKQNNAQLPVVQCSMHCSFVYYVSHHKLLLLFVGITNTFVVLCGYIHLQVKYQLQHQLCGHILKPTARGKDRGYSTMPALLIHNTIQLHSMSFVIICTSISYDFPNNVCALSMELAFI